MKEITIKKDNKSLSSGFLWKSVNIFAIKGMDFIIGIILARLLEPKDYGLIGMLTIFIVVSNYFINSGFVSSLIQDKNRSEVDFSTMFYFNFIGSLFFVFLLFLFAPSIANFYSEPSLVNILKIHSLTLIIGALSITQQTKLVINLDFKSDAKIAIISNLVSGIIGIIAAFAGYGVWALVIKSIIHGIIRLFALFYIVRWKPLFIFSVDSLKKLAKFGSNILLANILSIFFTNIYQVLIGKFFNPANVGYYSKGKQYPEMITSSLTKILKEVSFPVLASMNDKTESFISTYTKMISIIIFITIPVLFLFSLLAEQFVIVFLTEKWLPIVPLIQWLSLASIFAPVSELNMSLFLAKGKSNLFLRVIIIKFPIAVLVMLITVPLGLNAVVIGYFFVSMLSLLINELIIWKVLKLKKSYDMNEILYIFLCAIAMIIIVLLIKFAVSNNLLLLIICPVAGIATYYLFAKLFKLKQVSLINSILIRK